MHWAFNIGKGEDEGGHTGKVFGSTGSEDEAKWGNEGEIFGSIRGSGVAIVLLAEAHVALRVPLRHTNVVHLQHVINFLVTFVAESDPLVLWKDWGMKGI